MVTLYRRKNFKIYASMSKDNGYIIVNMNKDFEHGHSHVNNYKLAEHIIDLAIHYRVPEKHKTFIIDSLIRISSDRDYIRKLTYAKSLVKSKR